MLRFKKIILQLLQEIRYLHIIADSSHSNDGIFKKNLVCVVKLLPWIIIFIVGIIYWCTLSSYALPGDPSELIIASATLGVCHPTGYPFYVLLGKVATLVFFFIDTTRIINLMSCLYTILGLVVVYKCFVRLRISSLTASICISLLGFTPSLWNNATQAEVYSLQMLLCAFIIYQLLVYEQSPTPPRLYLLFFITGLTFGNHLTIVLIFFCLSIWVAYVFKNIRFHLRLRDLAGSIICFLLGASIVLLLISFDRTDAYNYLRQYSFENSYAPLSTTFSRLRWLMTGSQFGAMGIFRHIFSFNVFDNISRVCAQIMVDNCALFILGITGLCLFPLTLMYHRCSFGFLLFLWLTLLSNILYFSTYLRFFEQAFFIQGYLVLTLGVAIGLERLFSHRMLYAITSFLLVLFCICTAATKYKEIDKSKLNCYEVWAEKFLKTIEPNAAVFSEWNTSTLFWHQQYIKDINPGVLIVNASMSNWPRLSKQIPNRPQYYSTIPAGMDSSSFQNVGGFYKRKRINRN